MRKHKITKGFTLIELLVVISIVILLAAMSVPAMAGHMKQRRLKSAVWAVQMTFMDARSRAIGQRETHSLIFFVDSNSYTIKNSALSGNTTTTAQGAVNSIQCYDSNDSGSSPNYLLVENSNVSLPELIKYTVPTSNFQYNFYPDGTTAGTPGDKTPADTSTTDADWDITFSQVSQNDLKCFIDIMPITGKVSFKIE